MTLLYWNILWYSSGIIVVIHSFSTGTPVYSTDLNWNIMWYSSRIIVVIHSFSSEI